MIDSSQKSSQVIPTHPQDFSGAALACKVGTPVGLLYLPLEIVTQSDSSHCHFPELPTDYEAANTQRTLYPALHTLMAEPRLTAGKKPHGAVPVHLLPMWSPPALSATALLPALVHMHVVFNG